jgi:1,4-dihydroxy-2-naphthoate octaprenyltransferase
MARNSADGANVAGEVWYGRLWGRLRESSRGVLQMAGLRYWSASLLPALVGTTLAFWLRPPGFSFRWLGALEFLLATILLHAGFSFLQTRFDQSTATEWPASWLLGAGMTSILAACLLGLHLNSSGPGSIFLVFGLTTLFAGVLYVAPPFSFWRQLGGEIVICEGLGMLPVLGAYLVQTGDLTRTVYLATLPLVIATALWVCTDELITRTKDEKAARQTVVIVFGPRFTGRWVILALALAFYATLLLAVLTASISPLMLVALLTFPLVWSIVSASWTEYDNPTRMLAARRQAIRLHLVTCLIFAVSPLAALLS